MKNNRLSNKTFKYGIWVLMTYTAIMYILMYAGIPVLYRDYKQKEIDSIRANLILQSDNTIEELMTAVLKYDKKTPIRLRYLYGNEEIICENTQSTDKVGCYLVDYESSNIENFEYKDSNDSSVSSAGLIEKGDVRIRVAISQRVSTPTELRNTLFQFLPFFILVSVVISMYITFKITRRFAMPIIKLSNDAKRITELDFNIQHTIHTDDELEDLSYRLNELASTLSITLNDLTQANIKLEDDIEKERAKEEERRAYIATISHDLKTPLTVIKGQIEGMMYNVGKFKDHETYLKKNLELTNQMEAMIQDIIVSSKLDDLDVSLHLEECNLIDIIKGCLVNNEDYILNKNLVILEEYFNKDNVLVDYNLFNKAITNIITNSVVYSDSNSQIVINYSNKKLTITNICKDFDIENLVDGKIYKPFYRQDKSRNQRGSGLGLYITKKVFDMHKINLEIKYENDKVITVLLLDNIIK